MMRVLFVVVESLEYSSFHTSEPETMCEWLLKHSDIIETAKVIIRHNKKKQVRLAITSPEADEDPTHTKLQIMT